MESQFKKGLFSRGSDVKIKRFVAPFVPYIAMVVGLIILQNAWVAMCGYHLGMIIIILCAGTDVMPESLFKSRLYSLPLALAAFGACGGILLYYLWPLLNVPAETGSALEQIGLTSVSWPFFIIYFIIFNPLLEEYYWRGFLGDNTKRITLNDFFFAGYHLIVLAGKMEAIWLIVVLVLLTVSAWFWRQVDNWSQGLLPSVVSHFTGDVSVILTIYFMTLQ